MYYQRLSDEEILSGFRKGDADIIREYSTMHHWTVRNG